MAKVVLCTVAVLRCAGMSFGFERVDDKFHAQENQDNGEQDRPDILGQPTERAKLKEKSCKQNTQRGWGEPSLDNQAENTVQDDDGRPVQRKERVIIQSKELTGQQ